MDPILQIFRQIGDIFKKMPPLQRTNFIILSALTVGGLAAVMLWSARPEYALLYSGLNGKDTASIKAKLDERRIDNKVEGSSIFVPSKDVYEVRLQLASDGLPSEQGVGYEIFNKSTFGMTDYMQQLNYKRALEGELARTICSLKGIRGCRVHLAIPKRGIFEEFRGKQESHPSASVILDTAGAMVLSKDQVRGIVHLVSSSVEELDSRNVNVIDNRGNLLYAAGSDQGVAGLSSSQLEAKQSVESYLEKKGESMLTTILGAGKAIVRVSAEMNFDQVEKTEEKYDPDGAVARNETKQSETSTEAAQGGAAAGAAPSKTAEKSTTAYEISKTIAHIVNSSGTVRRMKIAVVVSGIYKDVETVEGKKKTVKKEYVPRTKDEKDMYRKLVMNALGFDAARGDEIEVNDAAFDTSFIDEEKDLIAAGANKDFVSGLAKQGGSIAFFVIALVLLGSMLKKVSSPSPSPAALQQSPVAAGQGPAKHKAPAAPVTAAAPAGQPVNRVAGLEPQAERMELAGVGSMEEARALSSREVDAAAGVIRQWLKE